MKSTSPADTADRNPVRPEYVSPEVRIMTELEVLSAFQVTAAGTATWWSM
jgi:hypothetical protein